MLNDSTVTNGGKNRASRCSKINLDIILYCPNIQDNNRYNIYIQFSIPYQDVVSRILSCLENNSTFSNRNNLSK